jgi:hypothetical protein
LPRLNQTDRAVDTITLPQSGVRITIRREATGADKNDALQAVIGESYNGRHGYARYLCYMAAQLIVDWDALDEKGAPLPVSPQELRGIADERDYTFLMEDVAKRVTLRDLAIKEGEPDPEQNFETPSTASSPETSSPTPVNSQAL